MQIDRNGLEVLDRHESLRRLGGASIGRLAITSGALPTVLPVSFRLVGDAIFIRTSRGTKLDAATRNAVVAFEVDEFDETTRSGWSVVVTGVASEVTAADEIALIIDHPLPRWAPKADGRIVAISTELVSGRVLHPEPAAG